MKQKSKYIKRIGEKKYNNQDCLMEIIEYNNCHDIIVEFQDKYRGRVHTTYPHFLSGIIKNPYYPSVYEVGIIGDKYIKNSNGVHTKEYDTWCGMLKRCFSKKYKEKNISYKDVTCCNEWLLFENFYEWLHKQENFEKWYNSDKWHLDKDILVKGNKIYSPDTCCLVPACINTLFTNHYKKIDTQKEFYIYKKNKEDTIEQVAEIEYNKGNITKQCYDAMMKYEVEITD